MAFKKKEEVKKVERKFVAQRNIEREKLAGWKVVDIKFAEISDRFRKDITRHQDLVLMEK